MSRETEAEPRETPEAEAPHAGGGVGRQGGMGSLSSASLLVGCLALRIQASDAILGVPSPSCPHKLGFDGEGAERLP